MCQGRLQLDFLALILRRDEGIRGLALSCVFECLELSLLLLFFVSVLVRQLTEVAVVLAAEAQLVICVLTDANLAFLFFFKLLVVVDRLVLNHYLGTHCHVGVNRRCHRELSGHLLLFVEHVEVLHLVVV